MLADLRRRGFSVNQLHLIVETLEKQFGARLFDATGGGGKVQLLTDGQEVYARTETGDLFNLLKTPAQPLLVVGNEKLLRELKGKVIRKKRLKIAD